MITRVSEPTNLVLKMIKYYKKHLAVTIDSQFTKLKWHRHNRFHDSRDSEESNGSFCALLNGEKQKNEEYLREMFHLVRQDIAHEII